MSDYDMILDLVSEDDQVIGKMESEEAHKLGLLHRAVHILVINREGKIYVRKRSIDLELYPGVWTTSVGEHVRSGRQYGEAAENALKGFLGLATTLSQIGKTRVKDEIENEMVMIYETFADKIPDLNPEHSEQGEFLTTKELGALFKKGATTPHLSAAIKSYLQSLNHA
ncbi:MAG: hypothetical protein KZQ95_03675 [Candidatus Thiodiazotropha sp. (ex Epidulcina cf. delphinae)]|nr:hypothetical protein [Candidatus Thiodiazotropha sp. (ex Epidulcina cf. delphinae)]